MIRETAKRQLRGEKIKYLPFRTWGSKTRLGTAKKGVRRAKAALSSG
jgi:hypothetical protein